MTARAFLDRLQMVVVTATLTSAGWILAGTVWLDRTGGSTPAAPATGGAPHTSAPPVNEGQVTASGGRLAMPVVGVFAAELSDTFAQDRGGRPHEAIDIMAPAGTLVVAAAPGTVEKLHWSDAGGNTVYVRSPDRRTIHYYAHLRDYGPSLAEGQAVRRGQRLGTVGSTGNADSAAPHLHFAVFRVEPGANWWQSGTAVDPYPLLVGE